MRVLVCTFATDDYQRSAALLRHTALYTAGACSVTVYGKKHVARLFDRYPRLLPSSRGYGWWAWKAWIILQTLDCTGPGDVVVYCDAAVKFERSLDEYVRATEHVLLFRLGGWKEHGYTNARWTKRDCMAAMGRDTEEHRAAYQLNAAVQLYRNTPAARAFLEEYLRWCVDVDVVNDSCVLPNHEGFQDHRHDQSVLSLLAVGHPAVRVARDPTQWGVNDPYDAGVLHDLPTPLVDHHRQKRQPAKVAVITPTVGGPHLEACVKSVQAQDLPDVEHYVVVDGPEHEDAVRRSLPRPYLLRKPVHVVVLPHNVGADGWNGHRRVATTRYARALLPAGNPGCEPGW